MFLKIHNIAPAPTKWGIKRGCNFRVPQEMGEKQAEGMGPGGEVGAGPHERGVRGALGSCKRVRAEVTHPSGSPYRAASSADVPR